MFFNGVYGYTHYFGVTFNKFRDKLGYGAKFGCANRREILWVGK
jgi:hypothetical protein